MATTAAQDRRAADIKRIHVLRGRLRLDDDAYRDLIHSLYGQRSSTDLTPEQRGAFARHLQRLADGQAPRTGGAKRTPLTPRQRKMFSLWQQLADAKLVQDRRMSALDAWIRQRTWLGQRVDDKKWLDGRREDQVIESLKRWPRRGMEEPDVGA